MTGSDTSDGCVFCRAVDQADGEPSLLICRGRQAFVILNLYPYNNGHLMVVPYRHVGRLADLQPAELHELMELTRQAELALEEAYQPQGLNLGMNLGRPAGAGVADHLHMHIVPRWSGDTNFISVLGNTRVMPETLDEAATRLRPIFQRLRNGA